MAKLAKRSGKKRSSTKRARKGGRVFACKEGKLADFNPMTGKKFRSGPMCVIDTVRLKKPTMVSASKALSSAHYRRGR